jgi:membrane-associated PAP2 superfamily phosphatase
VRSHILYRIGIPVAGLLLYTLIAWVFDADLRVARLVYVENKQWPGINNFPWNFLYDYAAYPAFFIAGISLVVLLLGFFARSLAKFRKQSLFLVLLLALGPGLVVNVIFKDNQGRARPREITEFGGKHQYSQIWQLGETGKNSSFPSGHASAAFYVMAPWFILRRKNISAATVCLFIGIGYGALIGATRIMQGGHFLSDVVWAGGFVYLTGEVLSLLLKLDSPTNP